MERDVEHLLVVDDNALNRDMLSRRLEKRGYRVTVAEDGRQALASIENTSFDLILLDVMMPGIGGLEVLESVRKSTPATELPVIMVTAKDQSEDIVGALQLGANDYVTKPLDFPVVLARCQTQLSLRKATLEVAQLNRQLEEKNQFIRDTFGRYVSDDVAQSVLDTPDGLRFGGEKRDVTLLMSDLRGFSAMCERLDPEHVVRILNLYLGGMTDVIVRHGGTIDEFIGDGIFVIFGAPRVMEDHAHRAVACALSMQSALASVNDCLRAERLPDVQMGIGIHTGEVVIGNVGSDRRAKFGAVGSNVNVAGRIETYSVGGQVLVSEDTFRLLAEDAVCRDMIEMKGKGLAAPVKLYDVQGLRSVGLELPTREEPLTDLRQPVDIYFSPLEGKHVGDYTESGQIVRIAQTGAEIASSARLPLWSNIRIHFDGFADQEDVYAKVVRDDGKVGARFFIRFTSYSDGLSRILNRIR